MTTEKRPSDWRPVIRAVLVGFVLFALDAIGIGQGFWTVLVGFVAIVVHSVLAGLKISAGELRRGRLHLAAVGVYALTVVLVWTYILTDRSMASRRADALIAACHAYEAKYGRYPDRLEELVPGFVERVPRARHVLAWGEFEYYVSPGEGAKRHHRLKYWVVPPFGRRLYFFEERRWSYVD